MKIRHKLGVYKDMPDFPRSDDLLFELNKNGLENGEFSINDIIEMISFKLTKTKLIQLMDILIENGQIKKLKNNNYILKG